MLDKLELLLSLARERHFGKAAAAAGVTQPTLSSAVKSLEENFGVLIVERGSRFRCFTPEGERVLDWARRLVGDAQTMRQEIDGLKRGLSGPLRLGVIPTALPFVTELTVPFRTRYPDVRFSITTMNADAILAGLENVETNIGISYVDSAPLSRFLVLPLYEERYVLLVAPDSPMAKAHAVTWAEAGRMPLCLLTSDMQNRRTIDRRLAEASSPQVPTLESDSLLILYSHVRSGEWASIIPARLAETMERPGRLKPIPLTKPTATNQIGLVAKRREPQAPLVSAFIAHAKRMADPTPAMSD